ncbi:MAG: RNA polymerase sigma factor [Patescibacteria group bacterium]
MMTPKQEKDRKAILSLAHSDFSKNLNSYASFKLSDKEGGEDMVQNTFIKTWSYLAKGGKIDAMKAFLYHILNNLIVDEYRKRKNKTTSLEVMLENGFEPSAPESESMFDRIDGKAAMLLIGKLPEAYRKVMRMRYVQDLSLKEMAAITGLSSNTMAVQLHRGLAKLKLLYKV